MALVNSAGFPGVQAIPALRKRTSQAGPCAGMLDFITFGPFSDTAGSLSNEKVGVYRHVDGNRDTIRLVSLAYYVRAVTGAAVSLDLRSTGNLMTPGSSLLSGTIPLSSGASGLVEPAGTTPTINAADREPTPRSIFIAVNSGAAETFSDLTVVLGIWRFEHPLPRLDSAGRLVD